MSSPEPLQIDPSERVAAIIREMIESDLRLRMLNQASTHAGKLPYILLAQRMRGEMRIALAYNKERRFLFFTLHEEESVVADIRVRFELRPTTDPQQVSAVIRRFVLQPPQYLLNTGRRDVLRIDLAHQGTVEAKFDDDREFRVGFFGERSYRHNERWPLHFSARVLEGLGEQSRTRTAGAPIPFSSDLGRRNALSKILATIAEGGRAASNSLMTVYGCRIIEALRTHLRQRHPHLATSHHFSELNARALVRVDAAGDVSLDPKQEDTRQLDIEFQLSPQIDGYEASYRFRLPDLIASGRYHERFLAAIKERFADRFGRKVVWVVSNWSKSRFHAFLEHPAQLRQALMIRTGEKTRLFEHDKDLVFLSAPSESERWAFLFEVDFDITSYPEVAVKDMVVERLLGYRQDDDSWQWLDHRYDSLPKEYLVKQLRMLRNWQVGMARGLLQQ